MILQDMRFGVRHELVVVFPVNGVTARAVDLLRHGASSSFHA